MLKIKHRVWQVFWNECLYPPSPCPNSYVEIVPHSVMVLGGETFGKPLVHEGGDPVSWGGGSVL